MTRQLDAVQEARFDRWKGDLVASIAYKLDDGVKAMGGSLIGVSVKNRGDGWLGVIKAEFDSGVMVAFCGAEDLGGVFIKAARDASNNKLRWREDKYVGPR